MDAPGSASIVAAPLEQRERILDAALPLMADGGGHAMSMRSLATACGLNVATLYHYFPSKAALLDAVIAHQNYEELLLEVPPVAAHLATRKRLAAMLDWIWLKMDEHDLMWKLLLGESLRGEPEAMRAAAELSDRFERTIEDWLGAVLPELIGDAEVNARVLRAVVYGFYVETIPLPVGDRQALRGPRASEVASIFVP